MMHYYYYLVVMHYYSHLVMTHYCYHLVMTHYCYHLVMIHCCYHLFMMHYCYQNNHQLSQWCFCCAMVTAINHKQWASSHPTWFGLNMFHSLKDMIEDRAERKLCLALSISLGLVIHKRLCIRRCIICCVYDTVQNHSSHYVILYG